MGWNRCETNIRGGGVTHINGSTAVDVPANGVAKFFSPRILHILFSLTNDSTTMIRVLPNGDTGNVIGELLEAIEIRRGEDGWNYIKNKSTWNIAFVLIGFDIELK